MWNSDYNPGYPGSGQNNTSYPPPPGPPPSDSNGYYAGNNGYGYAPPPGPPPPQQYGDYSRDASWEQNGPSCPPAEQQHYGPTIEGDDYSLKRPYFQYSQCTGRKKALCIGINYFGQDAELGGCINDAHNMKRFICQQYGYQPDDIVMLTDDSRDPVRIPTRQNMINAMQWLVRDAQPNDSLFFHYSGHGGSVEDTNGDEADGYDEVIYPVDFQESGHIVDDDLHDILVKPLPAGCRLTAIFDSCHSATALDLPYVYSTEGKIKEPNLIAEAGEGLLSAVSSYARGDTGGMFQSAMGIFKTVTGAGESKEAEEYTRATKTSPADVISWSGCKDSQTSADTQEAGRATGAMSYAFVTVLTQNPNQSYMQLLNSIRNILANEYSQKPQLSSSHPMDTDLLFIA